MAEMSCVYAGAVRSAAGGSGGIFRQTAADQRWEARDAQYLLGLLVDEGVARRDGLGVTGVSYGGGQSIQLAFLRGAVRGTISAGLSKDRISQKVL